MDDPESGAVPQPRSRPYSRRHGLAFEVESQVEAEDVDGDRAAALSGDPEAGLAAITGTRITSLLWVTALNAGNGTPAWRRKCRHNSAIGGRARQVVMLVTPTGAS